MPLIPLTRRAALQGLGVAAASSLVSPFARAFAAEPALTFLAVGDWGRDGAYHQADVAARMAETAEATGARFVLAVGDNFYEDGVTGVADPKWKTSFEDVYAAPSLQIPWQAALGNHDYHGNTQAQLDYAKTSSRWRMPARWYGFSQTAPDGARADFFVLDTSPMIQAYYADGAQKVKVAGQDVKAQMAWFEAALAASTADWKIVIGHHPVYAGRTPGLAPKPTSGESPEGGSPDLIASIAPLLKQHGAALYINGHDHVLQHILRDGAHFICTGAGSKTRMDCRADGGDFCSLQSGYTAYAVTRRRLSVAYRDYTGAELKVVEIERGA